MNYTIIILALIILVIYLGTLRYNPQEIEFKLFDIEFRAKFFTKISKTRK